MPRPAIPTIETSRLRLVSLSIDMIRLLHAGRLAEASIAGGFEIPSPSSMTSADHLLRRIEMIENDPAQHPWLNRAVVCRKTNRMVGEISFHHRAPDPFLTALSDHAAELGYTIEPDFRRRGYAIESALAMMQWAHRHHHVETFVLSVSPANEPSLRLAKAMGFTKTGEHLDEVDGLEYVMSASIRTILDACRRRPDPTC